MSTLAAILMTLAYLAQSFVIFVLIKRTHDLNVRLSKVEEVGNSGEE